MSEIEALKYINKAIKVNAIMLWLVVEWEREQMWVNDMLWSMCVFCYANLII